MTEFNIVRVSVHLTHFFNDHRQLSRLYINENLKTIGDLKTHLKDLFGIEKKFYLLSQNHYLPALQDIRVLSDGDSIEVVPVHRETEDELSVKRKKWKRNLPDNTAVDVDDGIGEENEFVKEKRKKKKKDRSKNKEIGGEEPEENIGYVKEKRKKNSEISQELVVKIKKKKNKSISNVNAMEIESIDTLNEPIKKRKRKSNSSEAEITLQNDIKMNESVQKSSKKIKDLTILKDQTIDILPNLEVTKTYNLNDIMDFGRKSLLENEKIDFLVQTNLNDSKTNNRKSDRLNKSKASPMNLSKDIFSEEDLLQSTKNNETRDLELSKTQMANWTDIEDSFMKKVASQNSKKSMNNTQNTSKNADFDSESDTTRKLSKTFNQTASLDLSSTKMASTNDNTLREKQNETNKSLRTSNVSKKQSLINLESEREKSVAKTSIVPNKNSKPESSSSESDSDDEKPMKKSTKKNISNVKSTKSESSDSESDENSQKLRNPCAKNKPNDKIIPNPEMRRSKCFDYALESYEKSLKKPQSLESCVNISISKSKRTDSSSESEEKSNKKSVKSKQKTLAENTDSENDKSKRNDSSSDSDTVVEKPQFKKPFNIVKTTIVHDNQISLEKNDSAMRTMEETGLDLSNRQTSWTHSEDSLVKTKQTLNNTTKSSESLKKDTELQDMSSRFSSWSESDSILTENEKTENTTINETLSQNLNTSTRSKKSVYQRLSSIGHLMSQLSETGQRIEESTQPNLPNSVANLENEKTSGESPNFVTKRRRIRVRKRPSKSLNSSEIQDKIETQSGESYFNPPRTAAAPKMHKRFSEVENEDEEDYDSPNVTGMNGNVFFSTPYSEPLIRTAMSVIPEEPTDFLKKPGFENLKNLTEPPKVDDEIVFKKLKLNEEYTPVLSEIIIGRVVSISNDRKKVEIKIIAGHEEFQEPKGVFSVGNVEEEIVEPEISVVDLEWSSLIEPKLVNGRN